MKNDDINDPLKTNDIDNTINTRRVTPNEVAYRDGYVSGQADLERQHVYNERLEENQRVQETENAAANGLLIGILFTGLIGLGTAAYFMLTPQTNPTTSTNQTPPKTTGAQPSPPPVKETKVIERTINRVQEVVVPTSLPQVRVSPPEVKVNVSTPQQPATTQPVPSQTQTTDNSVQSAPPQAEPTPNNTAQPAANSEGSNAATGQQPASPQPEASTP